MWDVFLVSLSLRSDGFRPVDGLQSDGLRAQFRSKQQSQAVRLGGGLMYERTISARSDSMPGSGSFLRQEGCCADEEADRDEDEEASSETVS